MQSEGFMLNTYNVVNKLCGNTLLIRLRANKRPNYRVIYSSSDEMSFKRTNSTEPQATLKACIDHRIMPISVIKLLFFIGTAQSSFGRQNLRLSYASNNFIFPCECNSLMCKCSDLYRFSFHTR